MHILKNVTIRKNSLLILLIQGTGNNFTGSVCLPAGWSDVAVSPEDGGKTYALQNDKRYSRVLMYNN